MFAEHGGMKIRALAIFIAIAPIGTLSARSASTSSGEVIIGKAQPTDGDSMRIGDKPIRLFGIDAVESAQTCDYKGQEWACGRASRKALERAVKGKTVRCQVRDMDRGRYVSVCDIDGLDINREQVRRGWAVAYTQFSADYVKDEIQARQEGLGLWRASFERPHDYRARLRREAAAKQVVQTPPSADCNLKGNISRSGTKIFHSPGQADYERTRINESAGERWFCDPKDAKQAGWRAAKR